LDHKFVSYKNLILNELDTYSVFTNSFSLYFPQLGHTLCGSLGFLQLGQGTNVIPFKA
jgi:hypothetical protein